MISFCTTIKNRADNLFRLIRSLQAMTQSHAWELVVADFASTDVDLSQLQPDQICRVVQTDLRYFNRSAGLNKAAASAIYDKLFFLDVDMLVPGNFLDMIDANVQPGSCWFPICYSLHKDKPPVIAGNSKHPGKANGWWRKEGCGMAGFYFADFLELGRWNDEIGKSYGREDGDLFRRSIGLERIRGNLPGLFHVWHPTTQSYREGYHQVKRKLMPRKK